MTVTVTSFRISFPEFGSVAAYPNAQVEMWLAWALLQTNVNRWGNLLDLGVSLYLAHVLTLQRQAMVSAAAGNPPGVSSGPVSGETVGPISASYDTQVASVEGAGNLNLTTYGTRLKELRNMVGAGGVQV